MPAFGPGGPGGLSVGQVSKRFGRTEVLTGASFDVGAGVLAALIGRNGSGKTTLLRILAGVLDPDAGEVSVAGSPPGRGLAGYVPPGDRGLYWRLTGRDNLEFFLALASAVAAGGGGAEPTGGQGVSRPSFSIRNVAYRKDCPVAPGGGLVDQAAQAVGARDLLDKRVGVCSTGQRRRLAIARGFVGRPPVVLLDEPFADLDEDGCADVERLCRGWADAGGTVLYAAPLEEAGPKPDVVLRVDGGDVG